MSAKAADKVKVYLVLEVEYEITGREFSDMTEHIRESIEKLNEQASVTKATLRMPNATTEWEMV